MTTEPKLHCLQRKVCIATLVYCVWIIDNGQTIWRQQIQKMLHVFWTRGGFVTAWHLALIYFCCWGVVVVLGGVGRRFSKFFSLRLKHGQSDENADTIFSQICLNRRELASEMFCSIKPRTAQRWALLLVHECNASHRCLTEDLPSLCRCGGRVWLVVRVLVAVVTVLFSGRYPNLYSGMKQTEWCLPVDLLTLKQTTGSTLASWLHAIGELSILTLDPAQVVVLDLAPVPTFVRGRGRGRAGVRVADFRGRVGVSGRDWSLGCRGLVGL